MIFIPFKQWVEGIGGPSTFMRNLREDLVNKSYKFIEDIENYRVADKIFFPISFSKKILSYFKKNNYPIIQRLDGVYYPSKHGIKYLYFNKDIKLDYLKYSDFIIFQSNYSRMECFAILGEMSKSKYTIIYNGTDKSIFYPAKKEFDENKIIFVTTGSFRNKDMIEPVVAALDIVAEENNIELKIVGPIISDDVKRFTDRKYIRCLGRMDERSLAKVLQGSDILIHCQLNPACPNTVIEAVSCGIPVVGFNTGAMKEVLYFAPELLAYVSDNIFQRYGDFNYKRLLERIKLCINNYKEFKNKFLKYSYLYDSKETTNYYIKVFNIFNIAKKGFIDGKSRSYDSHIQ